MMKSSKIPKFKVRKHYVGSIAQVCIGYRVVDPNGLTHIGNLDKAVAEKLCAEFNANIKAAVAL